MLSSQTLSWLSFNLPQIVWMSLCKMNDLRRQSWAFRSLRSSITWRCLAAQIILESSSSLRARQTQLRWRTQETHSWATQCKSISLTKEQQLVRVAMPIRLVRARIVFRSSRQLTLARTIRLLTLLIVLQTTGTPSMLLLTMLSHKGQALQSWVSFKWLQLKRRSCQAISFVVNLVSVQARRDLAPQVHQSMQTCLASSPHRTGQTPLKS